MPLVRGSFGEDRWQPVSIEYWRALGVPEPQEGEDPSWAQVRADNTATWKRPTVAAMGYLREAMSQLTIDHPEWKPDLVYYVALMAQCHVRGPADGSEPAINIYTSVVEGPDANDEVFAWLKEQMLRHFTGICMPDDILALASIDNDFARKMKVEGTIGLRIEALLALGRLTMEFCHRYWADCDDMPADAIADMDAVHQGASTDLAGLTRFLAEKLGGRK